MKILIVDDHPIVLSGCRALLAEAAGHGDAGSPRRRRARRRCYAAQRPDVTVIDINLPDISGFELARRLRDPRSRGAHPDVQHERRPYVRGAGDRVRRPGLRQQERRSARPSSTAIREVHAGRPLAAAGDGAEDRLPARRRRGGCAVLTPREREVLRLLAKGKSMSEIAALINVSYKTVATTCASLRAKFSARTPMQLIRIAVEQKIV